MWLVLAAMVMGCFAPISEAETRNGVTGTEEDMRQASASSRVGLVETKRGTNYDTYLLESGEMECVIYPTDKYYYDGRSYQPISRQVTEYSGTIDGIDYCCANVSASNQVFFSEGDRGGLVSLR